MAGENNNPTNPLLPRRYFLSILATTAAGIAAGTGFSDIFADNFFQNLNKIDDITLNKLQLLSAQLVSKKQIIIGTFTPIEKDGVKYQPEINPVKVAESLLCISYIYGGMNNVEKAIRYIKKCRGLHITEISNVKEITGEKVVGETSSIALGKIINKIDKKFPVPKLEIGIDTSIFYEQYMNMAVFAHELIHVEQQSNYGNIADLLEATFSDLMGGVVIAFTTLITLIGISETNTIINKHMNRRNFLKNMLKTTVFTVLGLSGLGLSIDGSSFYVTKLTPYERQAHLEGGSEPNILGQIAKTEPLKSVLRQILTLKKIPN